MKMLSIMIISLFICFFGEFTSAAYSSSNTQQPSDDGRIISERVVKSPWNVDKLSPGNGLFFKIRLSVFLIILIL